MKKHGAEMHFVRPDFVHRTSVLQAIPGYQPVSNAQAVAARFTAAPYFATFMNPQANGLGAHAAYAYLPGLRGNEDIVTKVKVWWANVKAKWMAKRVPAMAANISSMQNVPAAPQAFNPGLPNVRSDNPEAYRYGAGPTEQMAQVGLKITQGLVQTGEDALPPSIAVPENDAAGQLAPDAAARFIQITRMVENNVPGFVGRSAYEASVNRWNGLRSWWWMGR